jgi:hypothetical protein
LRPLRFNFDMEWRTWIIWDVVKKNQIKN